jgi:hypothetical protein
METKGRNYQKEFEEIMYDNDFIKPWSLGEFKTNPISLDCALEEISNIWNEDARFREGFLIDKENNVVNIPHLYVRVKGIKTNWNENDLSLVRLIQMFNKNSLHINMKSKPLKNDRLFAKHIQDKLDNNEYLDIDDIQNNGWFHKLNETIQTYIIGKLNDFAMENKDDYDIPNLAKMLGFIDKDFAQALNNWQFYNKVPKIFVKDVDGLSLQVLEWLDFLSFLGFDVMVFSPMGEGLLKKKTHCKDMRTFTLDKFDMEYKEYNEEKEKYNEEKAYKIGLNSFFVVDVLCLLLLALILISVIYMVAIIIELEKTAYAESVDVSCIEVIFFLIDKPKFGTIMLNIIMVLITPIIILGISKTFKVRKFIKQNKGMETFNKAYKCYLFDKNKIIKQSMCICLLILGMSFIFGCFKVFLFSLVCIILYGICFLKNGNQIEELE